MQGAKEFNMPVAFDQPNDLKKMLLFCCFLATTHSVFAADSVASTLTVPQSCTEQIKLYCENENSPGERVKCLFKNIEKLTESCRQEVKRFANALQQTDGLSDGSLINPSAFTSQTPPFTMIALDSRYIPGDDSMSETRLSISSPIKQTKETYLALSISGSQTHFNRDIPLSSGTFVLENLNRAEMGFQFSQKLSGFKNWGFRASVGSASDRLFYNSKDTTFSFIANYGYPTATGGFWMWTLFFSNNSPLGNYVPVPGVLYLYKTPTFTGMFGFPVVSLQWTPTKEQSYSFSLLGLAITTEAAYGDIRQLQYFINFKWANQSYLLSNRQEEKDRLINEEKKLAVGIRSFLWGHLQAEAEGGYAFDRIIYSGNGIRNMRSGSVDLDSASYVAVSLKAGF